MDSTYTIPAILALHAAAYEADQVALLTAHDRAMECVDLDDVLATGLALYGRFAKIAKKIQEPEVNELEIVAVQPDGGVGGVTRVLPVETPDEASAAAGWIFEWWLRPSETLLGEIRRFEDEGFDVASSAEFRRACSDALHATRWQRIRDARSETGGFTVDQLKDELLPDDHSPRG